jgi:hypothetical protein
MPKYCSARPRSGNWPSEERLNAIDVHSAGRPKANLADVVNLLPNRTLLLMGDSVMEQFYNTLQCFLKREEIELQNDVRKTLQRGRLRPCQRGLCPRAPCAHR